MLFFLKFIMIQFQKNNLFLYIFSILIFIPFFLNYNNFNGNKFLFFIFHLSSLGLLLTATKKNISAFEFFTYFFLLLSFWFKFSCILYFENIKVTEGDFDLSVANMNLPTSVIIVTFTSSILASYIKENFFFLRNSAITFQIKNSFLLFYKKLRISIFFILIGFLILMWSTNFYYKIYSRGLINEDTLPFIKYFFSWSFTYGLSVIVSLFVYIDYCIFKKKKFFLLLFFESFFTSITIFSRSFILIACAHIRGILFLINYRNFFFLKSHIINFLFLLSILVLLSFYITQKLRSNFFYVTIPDSKEVTLKKSLNQLLYLSVNRWVGIDALLAVSQSNKLNFKFFLTSFNEKKNIREDTFYKKNFFSQFMYSDFEKKNLNIVITPGFVAFLFYSGSLVFVFFSVFFLILICSLIERLFYKYSCGNILLSHIIGYALAIRLIHFGYVPTNTINYLFSLLITLILIAIFSKIIWKKLIN